MVHSASGLRNTPRPLVRGSGLARISGQSTLSTPVHNEWIHFAFAAGGTAALSSGGFDVPFTITSACGAYSRALAGSLLTSTVTSGPRFPSSFNHEAEGSASTSRVKDMRTLQNNVLCLLATGIFINVSHWKRA